MVTANKSMIEHFSKKNNCEILAENVFVYKNFLSNQIVAKITDIITSFNEDTWHTLHYNHKPRRSSK